MSAASHGGLSPRALSRTHAGKPISRNGAKTFKSLCIVCQMKIGTKMSIFLRSKSYSFQLLTCYERSYRKPNINNLHIAILQVYGT